MRRILCAQSVAHEAHTLRTISAPWGAYSTHNQRPMRRILCAQSVLHEAHTLCTICTPWGAYPAELVPHDVHGPGAC